MVWLSRKLIENLVKGAVDIGEWSRDASIWEEWEPEEQANRRSKKEEMWLWKQLDECDSRQAQLEKWQAVKKSRKVARARNKMKVGREQPGIMDKFVRSSTHAHQRSYLQESSESFAGIGVVTDVKSNNPGQRLNLSWGW